MAAAGPEDTKVEGRKILIAMDGSEHSEFALDWYCKHLHQKEDHVVVVHIPELKHILHSKSANAALVGPEVLSALAHQEHDKIKADLEKLATKLRHHHVGGKVKNFPATKPAEGILKAAEEEHAQLIVLGSRGKGNIRRTILGSVSDYVLHHSHIPVIICKHPHWPHHHHDRHH